jgi:nitrile hydratase subunit beta
MNGVHDMGGMHGMGPIRYEKNEPVFHARWESRVYALNRSIRAWGKLNIDAWRHDIELLPPADYLRFSYYEKWLTVLEKQLVKYGFVTNEEMASGKAASGSAKLKPALTTERARLITRSIPSSRDSAVAPLFKAGERVRTKMMNPTGHTRLPRYARDKAGVIFHDHGVYTYPDTNAKYEGEQRQHVYSVRFAARELWGEQASPIDSVHLDLWDGYLERA